MLSGIKQDLEQILQEKKNKIIPENIKSGITIFEVEGTLEEGTDTSDATATADDISSGKTAYANGNKITGTIMEFQNGNGFYFADDPVSFLTTGDTYTEVRAVPIFDMLFRTGSQINTKVKNTDLATGIGLTADKIVSGNSILGVTGTASAGTTADEKIGYDEYGLENMSSGELDNDTGFKFFGNANTQSKLYEVGSIVEVHISNELMAQVLGITADKIKSGEVICGIEGTYTGEASQEA